MTTQQEHVRQHAAPPPPTRSPSPPAPARSQALADELGKLERSEREARDRVRQQELERLREVARYD